MVACKHLSTTVVDRGEAYVFCNSCEQTWSEDAWTDFKAKIKITKVDLFGKTPLERELAKYSKVDCETCNAPLSVNVKQFSEPNFGGYYCYNCQQKMKARTQHAS